MRWRGREGSWVWAASPRACPCRQELIIIIGLEAYEAVLYLKYKSDFRKIMDEEDLGVEEQFEISIENTHSDPAQKQFHQTVMLLQELVVEEDFQSAQTYFMREHCHQQPSSEPQWAQLFALYRTDILQLLIAKISARIPGFDFGVFVGQLRGKQAQVDDEIVEIILSCEDVEAFKSLLADYKLAEDEEQRYRVLTIKTNKLPENKKVKGVNDNIFGASNAPDFGKKPAPKKPAAKVEEKTLEQLFVPETVLTVKGLRKA